MPVNIPRLRRWFAVAAISIAAIVAGFYTYARYRTQSGVKEIPRKIGGTILETTGHFSYSQSKKGRTLYTIRAEKATRYSNNRYELKDVRIIVYGRDSKRFDQIYGKDFEYDANTGDAIARGTVNIDLETDDTALQRPDQTAPVELKNPVHLLTSGLVFNKDSGKAWTKERIELRMPQASGWAIGATYESGKEELVLDRDVHITTTGPGASTITGEHGVITKEPRQAVLYKARIERQDSTINAAQLTAFLREDNSVSHVLATGGVTSQTRGATVLNVSSPSADVRLADKTNEVQVAVLTGGAKFQASGANSISGAADSVTINFGSRNLVNKVRAQGNVNLIEPPKPGSSGQTFAMAANAVDFWVRNGRLLQRAETSENAKITLTPVTQDAKHGGPTVITATKFYARFNAQNRISSMLGTPGARVVSYAPGKPERVSTSQTIEVEVSPSGGAERIIQRGNFEYREQLPKGGQRAAWAQSATYSPATQVMTLSGKPRVVEGGMTTTAHEVRVNRVTGEAFAEGGVKTTYSDVKPQPGGALLASGEPIHVTARSMLVQQASNVAHYEGNARLWQGANIIQAPAIDFDRARRAVVAKGEAPFARQSLVTTVLVQQGKNGKQTPVHITAHALTYEDPQHVAHYTGRVTVRSAEGTVTADKIDVLLKARETGASPAALLSGDSGPSRVERIVAEGGVRLLQPTREAVGEKLVYTAAEDKFVLTGGQPSFTDAEHGRIQGASLTFYNRDGRVLVEGGGTSRPITNTRVPERVSK